MTAWTTPASYTASEVVGAAKLNTHIRDNLNHLYEQINASGWTSFTPSWTNLTVGSGTNVGRKAYAGKTTLLYVSFTFGSGSAVGTDPILTLPDTAVALTASTTIAQVVLNDSGGSAYQGVGVVASTTAMLLRMLATGAAYLTQGQITATVPFTWATGDQILITGFYERA
jgi:hypothetical protein